MLLSVKEAYINTENTDSDYKNMGKKIVKRAIKILCILLAANTVFVFAVGGVGSFMTVKPEKRYDFWKEVMKNTGAKNLEEFRKIPVEDLFREWKKVKGSGMSATPVYDGILIKDKACVHKIPYMVGCTSHDIAPAVLYMLTKKWAVKNGAYMWLFERALPSDDKGAWHSSDLWYWFGTLKNCWRPMEKTDYEISEEMSDYLCSFVKIGNPNGEGDKSLFWSKCRRGKDVLSFGDGISSKGKIKMLIYNTITNKPVGE